MRLVNLTGFDFLRDVALRYFVTAVVVSFLDDFVEVFQQVDDENLASGSATDQDMSGEWVELHGGDLMLRVNSE